MVNLPFPVRIWLERVGSSATPGEKGGTGENPIQPHTTHVKNLEVTRYSCNLLNDIHSPIYISIDKSPCYSFFNPPAIWR